MLLSLSAPVTAVYALDYRTIRENWPRVFEAKPRKSAELSDYCIEKCERQLSGSQPSTVSDGSWPT
jgi:hypothetical protein